MEKKKSKFQIDREKARQLRIPVIAHFTEIFRKHNLSYDVDFVHKLDKNTPTNKISKINTAINRTSSADSDNSLGYDIEIKNFKNQKSIYIMIRFPDDANCFIKNASDNLNQPQFFIDHLVSLNAHFLYVKKDSKGNPAKWYSNLIPLKNYAHKSKWIYEQLDNNNNRIVIPSISPAARDFMQIEESTLFGGSFNLLTQIKQILE